MSDLTKVKVELWDDGDQYPDICLYDITRITPMSSQFREIDWVDLIGYKIVHVAVLDKINNAILTVEKID